MLLNPNKTFCPDLKTSYSHAIAHVGAASSRDLVLLPRRQSRLACDEPFGRELRAERLSRVEASPTTNAICSFNKAEKELQ